MEFRYQSDMVRVAFLVIKLCLIMCCSGCNVKLRGDSGALESPKHPDHHGSQVRCEWSISTSPGTKVRLTFTDLELKDVNGCKVDYIQIRNGNNKDAPLLAKLCGEKKSLPPGPITASGNNMFIEFSTDRRTPLGGFQAMWAADLPPPKLLRSLRGVDPSCGENLSGSGGTFNSPNYPQNYPDDSNCVWTIQASSGRRVKLAFSSFSLESSGCSNDYVLIRDGSSKSSTVLGKHCGVAIPQPVTSSGSSMTVEFHSDSISEYQGFLATWTSVESTGNVIKEEKSECGEDLTGPQGTFQSPNYPEYTDTINRCVWTITTPPRTRPKLTFTDLRLGQCQFTYIYIRIGNADTSPLFSRYCGTSVPYPITLFGNSMYIDFRNIKAGIKARFKAEWATEL